MTAAATPLPPFKSIRYAGPAPGLKLIVTGAVHGNETCGTRAIERLMGELDAGQLVLGAGSLTLVPIANPKAYVLGQRAGDRNLNRALQPSAAPRDFEDHVANWLCPLLARHEVLLDLHSFQAQGLPFVMLGPLDNSGDIEPFSLAAKEEALARCLGVQRAVDGWLDTYAAGMVRRKVAAEMQGRTDPGKYAGKDAGKDGCASGPDLHPRYGIGTTEYMRSQGGWALTLECGQHDDPQSPLLAYRAIRNTLAQLGLTNDPAPPAVANIESLSLHQVVDKVHADDAFCRPWQSFDALRAGEVIGTRANGEPVLAPQAGRIVFPNSKAEARQEWFYLARASTRFGATESSSA